MYALFPRKIKRYLTQPDELPLHHQQCISSNSPLTELKIHINQFQNLNEIVIPKHHNFAQHKIHSFAPMQAKIQNKRKLMRQLPDISQECVRGEGGENRGLAVGTNFRKKNPLFVVNSLYQIMKQDFSDDKNCFRLRTNKDNNNQKNYNNQFKDFATKSIKFQRPPKIIGNQFNRITQKSAFQARMICSEGKAREKNNEISQVELLTFYKPKQTTIQNHLGQNKNYSLN